jgi:hypothetical protein
MTVLGGRRATEREKVLLRSSSGATRRRPQKLVHERQQLGNDREGHGDTASPNRRSFREAPDDLGEGVAGDLPIDLSNVQSVRSMSHSQGCPASTAAVS